MNAQEASPLHTELPWFGLVSQQTLLTKSGELIAAARFEGAPFECRDGKELDFVSMRWMRALKSLKPGWRIRWQVRKRRLLDLPLRLYDDPLVRRAQTARRDHLLQRGLYGITTSVYWIWDPKLSPVPPKTSKARSARALLERTALWLSQERTRHLLSTQVESACQRFESEVGSFCGLVNDVTPIRPLQGEELFRDLAETMNSRHAAQAGRMNSELGLDQQVALSDLEAYRSHLMLDDERIETYALLDPPPLTRAHLFSGILDLDIEFDLAAEWRREAADHSRNKIRTTQRHYHQKRYSMMAHASAGEGTPQSEGALQDQAAEAEASQLGNALSELEVEGVPFGEYSLCIALRATDPGVHETVRPELLRIAASCDARFHRETYNGLNAWFTLAPGNHHRQLRSSYLSASVVADLAPLWSVPEGNPKDLHLRDEYLAVFETQRRTPYYFTAHAGDVAHSLIIGATGSGKSFLLNFLLSQARKYDPRVCILDLGGSYRQLTELVGGAYLEISLDPGAMSCRLNPFRALGPTPDNLQFLESFVRMLLHIVGHECDSQERTEVREQILSLYELEPSSRTLTSLCELLPRNLRAPLEVWTSGGAWGSVFDNPDDTLTLADWQVLDLASTADKPELTRALLYYLLHRLSTMVTAPSELQRWKLLVVDEAWRFLADPEIGSYLASGLKTWRKHNAGVILATQSPGDAEQSGNICRTVSESCLTKIFLANQELDVNTYMQAFGLQESEAEAIRALIPKRQLLLHRPGSAQVLNLSVDRRSYWLFTTNPFEAARRQEAIRSLGIERGLDSLEEQPS